MSVHVAVSDSFDDFAAGRIKAHHIICVLCKHAPCDCPKFGTPEYFALIDQVHGVNRNRNEA